MDTHLFHIHIGMSLHREVYLSIRILATEIIDGCAFHSRRSSIIWREDDFKIVKPSIDFLVKAIKVMQKHNLLRVNPADIPKYLE